VRPGPGLKRPGQLYRSAAVLGAGAELPQAQRPDQWAGQPGTRAPHLWVMSGGQKRSTLDLFQRGWVLLSEDGRWADATTQATGKLGIPMSFIWIGADAKPLEPEIFGASYGISTDGATLVRTDGYIAWRSVTAPADPAGALTGALGQVASAAARQSAASA
jgi:putative polyketide hydroxylase